MKIVGKVNPCYTGLSAISNSFRSGLSYGNHATCTGWSAVWQPNIICLEDEIHHHPNNK